MQITLETNIGTVTYKLDGHFIHVFTEQESAREIHINLWNHATKDLRIETSIDAVFLEVAEALTEYFPSFQVGSFVVDFAPLEKLVESTLIKAYVEAMKLQEERSENGRK